MLSFKIGHNIKEPAATQSVNNSCWGLIIQRAVNTGQEARILSREQ